MNVSSHAIEHQKKSITYNLQTKRNYTSSTPQGGNKVPLAHGYNGVPDSMQFRRVSVAIQCHISQVRISALTG